MYTLTITNFEVNDTGLYRCLTLDDSWQDSFIQITHAGDLMLTADKQYAQLQGNITLTCNTSESVTLVEFWRGVSLLGKCEIELGCSTSNESKFILNSNLQPVGYDMYTLTITNFEVNDTGLYRCLTWDDSWQDSFIQITHAGDLMLTADKQYAQLQGNITLTCNTSESVKLVEFQSSVPGLGKCEIELGCSTSNESKFILNSNLQPVGYDMYTLTITNFEVNDTGLYRCLTLDDSWQDSFIQITHAVDINSVNLTPKTNLISVIENVPQIFQCVTSTCRPVATISWYLGSKLIKTGKESNTLQDVTTSTLNYTFKKKHQDKRIICRGSNGGQVLTSDNQPRLNVLFPPVVKPLTNVTVLEEGTVSVVCEVTAGVPSKNDFKWDRMSDSTNVSMEQSLSIANIDRKQTGYYRCTASNYMEPTGHDATVGISSNTVYIDVQYEAEVTSFTLLNAYHGQNFEVNENTQVIFYCQAHSNPSSNLALLKQSQYLKTTSDAKQLDFTINKSVCEDEGIYQCTAQNEHNTKANIRSLELFVRCAPRASALSQRDQNVTIAPGEPAAFTLKLVAFPRPRAKDFVWEKKVSASSTWNIVSNDTDIVITISTDGLQTKLFFSSVDEKDFGYYRVHVNNELGNYTETFLLQAQDDSAGSVIAGAVCGTLAVVVVVTVVVVILRRKYTVNCNFERKRDPIQTILKITQFIRTMNYPCQMPHRLTTR
ncbi:vascular cell adhesion protein 1-like [Mya arenaria]|uniref:vascular cell adhesion protein 1-like n=1 Tax=Mya arenaria TaxID=6604 RepID=UPI0022E0ACD2|nr:vascular cell adhesion protein 1-like [Mya arenaria]